MYMRKNRVSDDTIVNIVAIVAIVAIVISSLMVVAAAPAAGDSVNVFAVGGVTAVAGFLRRPQTTSNAPA